MQYLCKVLGNFPEQKHPDLPKTVKKRTYGLQLTLNQPLSRSVLAHLLFSLLALDRLKVGTIFHFHHHCLISSSFQPKGTRGSGRGGVGVGVRGRKEQDRGREPAKQSCPGINWWTITLFPPGSHNLSPLASLHLIG